ncbi:hypothetical protein TNCT_353361 [Trichonephila clavata]|uniref:Uncharacterized protein n=1 Tax=Trichonephila clavata TaxID=2740835 RepID=A0A8X6J989_TRICU|nr:hypothetical protein TNCT_552221 [Trichonephila clavata]GFQ95460.1 hypothetical protein TNCT_171631 [Trichonephila clavata]GFQ97350.1 hypothetical protein TNCT_465941 [Trichonephila clavata]GFR22899.1 hypothetical protein TNCT_353361 [Trichonephila clavata]
MDPDGIWENVPPPTFRHSDTIGIIAFSYKNKKPTELTIATRTRNMSFPIVSETWYEDLQAEYIDPLDINRLQVYGGNKKMMDLLRMSGVKIEQYHCRNRQCKICFRYGCSVQKAKNWLEDVHKLKNVKLYHC